MIDVVLVDGNPRILALLIKSPTHSQHCYRTRCCPAACEDADSKTENSIRL